MNTSPRSYPARNAVGRGVALALVLSGTLSIGSDPRAAAAALTNEASPTPSSVSAPSVDPHANGASQLTRKLFMSLDPPPPETVPQGSIQKGNDRFYLYRNPTRLEQWIMWNTRSEKENKGFLTTGKRTPNPGLTRAGGAWSFTRPHGVSFRNPSLLGIMSLLFVLLALQSRSVGRHHIPFPLPASSSAFRRPAFSHKSWFSFFHNINHAPKTHPTWKDPWTPKNGPIQPSVLRDPQPKHESIFTGSIEIIPLDSVLQILSNENKSGRLFVRNEKEEGVGYFQFCKGEVSDVRFGKLMGEEATCRLLSLEKGFYSLRTIRGCEKTRGDTMNITALLLEAHRRMDEEKCRHAKTVAGRRVEVAAS